MVTIELVGTMYNTVCQGAGTMLIEMITRRRE